jgi:hypothetical protein
VVGSSSVRSLAIGITVAATSSANSRVRCSLGVSMISPSEDSTSSTSSTGFVNATRFEGVFCTAPSNAESFHFKADLFCDFKTKRETEELSRCGLARAGLVEAVGVRLFKRACQSRRIWVLMCGRTAVIALIRSSKTLLGSAWPLLVQ